MLFRSGRSKETARSRGGSARYQNFLATIHLHSFTFKEGLGRHIDNDLRLALEPENV